jgi:hypothetical protein
MMMMVVVVVVAVGYISFQDDWKVALSIQQDLHFFS